MVSELHCIIGHPAGGAELLGCVLKNTSTLELVSELCVCTYVWVCCGNCTLFEYVPVLFLLGNIYQIFVCQICFLSCELGVPCLCIFKKLYA